MKHILILAALFAASAHACEPKEAGGAGTTIRKAIDDTGNVGVLVWSCGPRVEWVGVRNKTDMVLPRDQKAVKLHVSRLQAMHGYDRLGMADLKPLVEFAK